MKRTIQYVLGVLLILMMGSHLRAYAQTYNPTNPTEPQARFQVIVQSDPESYGYVSGAGRYTEGTQVYLSTSSRNTNYKFKNWTLNGAFYSESQSCTYTMGNEKAVFVAHYAFEPGSPAEPTLNLKNRLFLTSDPEGCCSFNRTSGAYVPTDNYVAVTANPNQGYDFLGWFKDGTKVSDAKSFNYYVEGSKDITLTARFKYNPANPGEPTSGGGDDIDNGKTGDLDGNKQVNVTDAVMLIQHYLNGTTNALPKSVADVNNDGNINVTDAVAIIQIYLKGE